MLAPSPISPTTSHRISPKGLILLRCVDNFRPRARKVRRPISDDLGLWVNITPAPGRAIVLRFEQREAGARRFGPAGSFFSTSFATRQSFCLQRFFQQGRQIET